MSMARGWRSCSRRQGYGAFLKARLTRLYPLHLFMLLALLALLIAARSLAWCRRLSFDL